MPGFAKRGHFFLEGLQGGFIVHILHVEQLHRHVPMPAAFVYYNNKKDLKDFALVYKQCPPRFNHFTCREPTRAYLVSKIDVLIGNVPLTV